ncbi:MAG: RNA polymerase sigma factor [Planctomycetota bacterium]
MTQPGNAPEVDEAGARLRGALSGRTEDEHWLIEHFTGPLLAIAHRHHSSSLKKLFDPEDLVQDTWVIAWQRLPDLEATDGRFAPVLMRFLASVLLNRYRNVVRSRAVRRATRGGSAGDDPASELTKFQDPRSGVITKVARTEATSGLHAQLEKLDEVSRSIVVLHVLEGRTAREVGEMLEMSSSSVATRYYRALATLKRSMAPSHIGILESLIPRGETLDERS